MIERGTYIWGTIKDRRDYLAGSLDGARLALAKMIQDRDDMSRLVQEQEAMIAERLAELDECIAIVGPAPQEQLHRHGRPEHSPPD